VQKTIIQPTTTDKTHELYKLYNGVIMNIKKACEVQNSLKYYELNYLCGNGKEYTIKITCLKLFPDCFMYKGLTGAHDYSVELNSIIDLKQI